jgi:drug/metabolite transporter (DMT)-like permease
MSSGVVLGTSAALCWGVVDVAIALLARRAPFVTVAVVVQGASVVMLAALAVALGDVPELSGGQWVAVAALGPVGTGAYLAFYRALQLGPLAIVSPIASANGAVVVVLAVILLGDSLSGTQALGAAVVLCCVVLAAVDVGERVPPGPGDGDDDGDGDGVRLAVLATVMFAGYLFALVALAEPLGWLLPILLTRMTGLPLLAAIVARRRERPWRLLGPGALALACAVGWLESAGFLLFNRGAEIGQAALTSAAAATYPLVPVACGLLLLHERLRAYQAVGIAGVLAGMTLLAL